MALTKGQKKRRDTEYAEAKTVTDPERIAELLESRFNYLSFRVLAERHDIWPYLKVVLCESFINSTVAGSARSCNAAT